VRAEFERAYEAIDAEEHEDEQEVCFLTSLESNYLEIILGSSKK
jgi:hypothetical protein